MKQRKRRTWVRAAVSVLLVLFAIGYALFCKADKLNKERQA